MKKNLLENEQWGLWAFIILLLIYFFYIGTFQYLFYGPDSIHFIRQIDSLNFIQYYRENGMSFLNTGSYSLESIQGKGVCEFPLHYYFIAWFENVFGENILYLRFWNFIWSSIAITLFYKTIQKFINFWPISVVLSLLLFSSGVLQYYQNNYLPDATAWSFSLIGLYFAKNYLDKPKFHWIVWAFTFLTWAALLKPTFLLVYGSLSAAIVISDKSIFKHKTWIAFQLSSIVIVFAWAYYINHYNTQYNNFYFLTNATPIWKLNLEERAAVADLVTNFWWTHYYVKPFHIIFLIVSLVGLGGYKKANRFLYFLALFSLLGSFLYIVLFYKQFRDHDYYFILLSFTVFINILNSLIVILQLLPTRTYNYVLLGLIVVGLVHSSIKVKRQLNERYILEYNLYYARVYKDLLEAKPIFDALQVKEEKLLIYPEEARNGGLYALKRYGWAIANWDENTVRDKFDEIGFYEGDNTIILLTDTNYNHKDYLKEFLGDEIMRNGKISAFRFDVKYRQEAANQRIFRGHRE